MGIRRCTDVLHGCDAMLLKNLMDKGFSGEGICGMNACFCIKHFGEYLIRKYNERGSFKAQARCVGLDRDLFIDRGDCACGDS